MERYATTIPPKVNNMLTKLDLKQAARACGITEMELRRIYFDEQLGPRSRSIITKEYDDLGRKFHLVVYRADIAELCALIKEHQPTNAKVITVTNHRTMELVSAKEIATELHCKPGDVTNWSYSPRWPQQYKPIKKAFGLATGYDKTWVPLIKSIFIDNPDNHQQAAAKRVKKLPENGVQANLLYQVRPPQPIRAVVKQGYDFAKVKEYIQLADELQAAGFTEAANWLVQNKVKAIL